MIIKFHKCGDVEYNSIIWAIKLKENEILKSTNRLPFISYLISRKIIIIHDYNSIKLIYHFLIEYSCFDVTCSIISASRKTWGGYGAENKTIGLDPIFGCNLYEYELINFKSKLFYRSRLSGMDNEYHDGVFMDEFNLKLILWDLIFATDNLDFIQGNLNFFQKYNTFQSIQFYSDNFDEDYQYNYGFDIHNLNIYESYFNGSIIDFIFKNEISNSENQITSLSQNKSRLLSSYSNANENDFKIINECSFIPIINYVLNITYIYTETKFESIEKYLSAAAPKIHIADSSLVVNIPRPKSEQLIMLINQQLLNSTYNYQNTEIIYGNGQRILFIDCETTSIKDDQYPPRLVSLSWALTTLDGKLLDANDFIIKPKDFQIDEVSISIHGINQEFALKRGTPIKDVRDTFQAKLIYTDDIAAIVGHNLQFDVAVLKNEDFDLGILIERKFICTMKSAAKEIFQFEKKWPKLDELFYFLYDRTPLISHNSLQDVHSTMLVYFKMVELGYLPKLIPVSSEKR